MPTADPQRDDLTLRTRVLMEVLSGTLQVRLQVYNYAALITNRRPDHLDRFGHRHDLAVRLLNLQGTSGVNVTRPLSP